MNSTIDVRVILRHHFLLLLSMYIVSFGNAIYAASESDHGESVYVGNVQIMPFFKDIPELADPVRLANTNADENEAYENHLRQYREKARLSMQDGIVPTHQLIRRLARRNITIAYKSKDTYETLIKNENYFVSGDEVNSPFRGLSVKYSLQGNAGTVVDRCRLANEMIEFKAIAIPRQQCIDILGQECVDYLEQVKTKGSMLWHAIHGKEAHVKMGYYTYLHSAIVGSCRQNGVHPMFVKIDSYLPCEQGVSRSEVIAAQTAALLSIMRFSGEAVVQKCKEALEAEWLQAYRNESPCPQGKAKSCPLAPCKPTPAASGCTIQ